MPSRFVKVRLERVDHEKVKLPAEVMEAMYKPKPIDPVEFPHPVASVFQESEGPVPESTGPYPSV